MGSILGACASGGVPAANPARTAGVGRVQVTETTVDAPAAEVWRLFTTREGIESWMAAKADIDLRVGGAMRTLYDPTGKLGDPNTITNTILSYEPQRMLSLQATGFPKDFPYRKGTEGTWSVLYFEELPGGRTHLRLVGYAFFENGPLIITASVSAEESS
jgi:uncharacterized protein YndB with AHSA1/START domain